MAEVLWTTYGVVAQTEAFQLAGERRRLDRVATKRIYRAMETARADRRKTINGWPPEVHQRLQYSPGKLSQLPILVAERSDFRH